jgi:hypothetical protein
MRRPPRASVRRDCLCCPSSCEGVHVAGADVALRAAAAQLTVPDRLLLVEASTSRLFLIARARRFYPMRLALCRAREVMSVQFRNAASPTDLICGDHHLLR